MTDILNNVISVIILTLNAENYITELVNLLKMQTISPIEIIVIDSSSTDNTVKLANDLGCKVLVIDKKQFDHGGTRNLGARTALGDVIVFMTQDALPVNEFFLQNLVNPLLNSNIAASFGRQVAKDDAIPPEKFARIFNYPETAIIKSKKNLEQLGIKTFFFSDVCSAFKRSEFEKVGGFPERIIMNEDMIIASKLVIDGYEIMYAAEAMVWHSHNYNFKQQFQRYFDIGVSHSQNRWVFKYAKPEGEGIRFVKQQFSYLIKNKHISWVPYSVGLTISKYVGYKLGLWQKHLPVRLKERWSMHSFFWKK